MISHNHKFIFIHIPKCGGTSIEYALLEKHNISANRIRNNRLTLQELVNFNLYYKWDGVDVHHYTINQYDPANIKKYFTFAFVRNPWDKFLSEYFYIKNCNGCNCVDFQKEFPTFKHFVINNGIKCCWYSHDFLQVDFVLNAGENKLTNFIGRFESLQQDFDTVCDKIGIRQQKLPHIFESKHKHYTEYYDEETKQIVAEKYAKDIEYFGYEFGQ